MNIIKKMRIINIREKIYKIFNKEQYNSREHFIKSIPSEKSILEIGPFFNPVCVGNNVEYFDILNQEALKERATEIGYKDAIDRIPHIDYVSPIGDLNIIHKKFDTVISCHAIEHQLDLISHLQSVSKMLVDGGCYCLIIPDKRYCFDHFMAPSTIAEVIQNFYEKKLVHSLKSVVEHRALTTHNYPMQHWKDEHGDRPDMECKIEMAIKEYEEARGQNIDVHAWYFTPISFETIITLLNKLKYINLSIKEIIPTSYGSLEFYVVLENSNAIKIN